MISSNPVEQLEKFLKINQLDGFAELQYKYASISQNQGND
jgi:hypothetical protein